MTIGDKLDTGGRLSPTLSLPDTGSKYKGAPDLATQDEKKGSREQVVPELDVRPLANGKTKNHIQSGKKKEKDVFATPMGPSPMSEERKSRFEQPRSPDPTTVRLPTKSPAQVQRSTSAERTPGENASNRRVRSPSPTRVDKVDKRLQNTFLDTEDGVDGNTTIKRIEKDEEREKKKSSKRKVATAGHENLEALLKGEINPQKMKFRYYILSEFLAYDYHRDSVDAGPPIMESFFKVFVKLEKYLLFSTLLCLDVFLSIFTVLPVRTLWAVTQTLLLRQLPVVRICDILRVLLIACGTTTLYYFTDPSIMYHMIRGQSLLKLYVIFNMLEVMEKLFRDINRDSIDEIFRGVSRHQSNLEATSFLGMFVWAAIVQVLHAFILFFQVMTLNVALNSHNNSLMTLMISNQFVELKSHVFKSFKEENIKKMLNHDVLERHNLLVFFVLITLRNLSEMGWDYDYFKDLLAALVGILVSEIVVDTVKHSFISRFNNVPLKVYETRMHEVALEVSFQQLMPPEHHREYTDLYDLTLQQLGFVPIPLVCVVIRTMGHITGLEVDLYDIGFTALIGWLCAVAIKLCLGQFLSAWAKETIMDSERRRLMGLKPMGARILKNKEKAA
eukprot:Clim_evm12s119 gene=Clim_evmTU12s119